MTVNEVSKISGVSIRTLHHYDNIGLLPATEVTAAGYRLYDGRALERLQMILLFKELQFPLKDIAVILDSPDFDKCKALEQQIRLLELRREHLGELIALAQNIKLKGVYTMNKSSFEVFGTEKIDEYAAQAKAEWGGTEAYREFEEKSVGRSEQDVQALGAGLMEIFVQFGKIKDGSPDSTEAQALVKALQSYISEHYYTCTDAIIESLGQMYAGGGDMTANIDRCAGVGTANFANEAITTYLLAKL